MRQSAARPFNANVPLSNNLARGVEPTRPRTSCAQPCSRNIALLCCGADYVFSVKGNAPATFAILDSIDWDRDASGCFTEDLGQAHGRLKQRSIRVLTPLKRLINYPGVNQIARVRRYREPLRKGR